MDAPTGAPSMILLHAIKNMDRPVKNFGPGLANKDLLNGTKIKD